MTRIPMDSSSIASVGYEPEKRLLEVEFVTGRLYEYAQVPEPIFRGLQEAESAGRFFSTHIRSAGFPYRKLA
ncbi:MAG TPA: KTSC domain-containing protein [Longimicrobium sp.]|jgi:hypothetical protein|uniref:KTSC domain-containing protein n=1 Tax=Longimicrobium sp. TaxID=2029185 RepID=UPI002ED96C9C